MLCIMEWVRFSVSIEKSTHNNNIFDNRQNLIFLNILGPIEEGDETVYHAYYQWVPLMLMFQAICFYMPHWIWKQLDNGKMKVNMLIALLA